MGSSTTINIPQNTTGMIWGVPSATVNAFNLAYWKSQPTAVQALYNADNAFPPGGGDSSLVTLAKKLMSQGYIVDVPIMVWGGAAYFIMLDRFMDGFSWVPSAGQSSGGGTGPVPPGSIAVPNMTLPLAQLLALYPPFNPPPPPTPTPTVNPVGNDMSFTEPVPNTSAYPAPFAGANCEVFSCAATDPHPVGYVYTNASGVQYLKFAFGTELMDATDRVCVWLEAPAGAATVTATLSTATLSTATVEVPTAPATSAA